MLSRKKGVFIPGPNQEESLLSFVKNDKIYYKYYDELIILLDTRLRISEFCGLMDRDIDFENRTINVDHQQLPQEVAQALVDAAAEALRNSLTHAAGPDRDPVTRTTTLRSDTDVSRSSGGASP